MFILKMFLIIKELPIIKFSFISALASLFLASPVYAAKEVGNGGNILVCYTDTTKTTVQRLQLFDHWEQSQVNGQLVEMGPATMNVNDKITLVTNRIAQFDPALATELNDVALGMSEHINEYFSTDEIPSPNDYTPEVTPNDPVCEIKQFAVQIKDVGTGQKRFVISESFYTSPLLSNNDRAGLLLHEALYRKAITKFGAHDSNGVRKLNYQVSAKPIVTIDQYVQLLKQTGFYDKTCEDYGGSGILGRTTERNQVCFNQTSTFGKVTLNFRQGQNLSMRNEFLQVDGWIRAAVRIEGDNVVVDDHGVPRNYFVRSFSINPAKKQVSLETMDPANGSSSLPTISLPSMQPVTCETFSLDWTTGDLVKCVNKDRYSNGFYSIEPITSPGIAKWHITGVIGRLSLPIFGSKKGQKMLLLDTAPLVRNAIQVDLTEDGSIVKYSTQDLPIFLQSHPSKISLGETIHQGPVSFEVKNTASGSMITLVSSIKSFDHPQFDGKRFFDTQASETKYPSIFLCTQNGYTNGGTVFSSRGKTYIDASGANLLNAVDGSNVYKSDEYVFLADAISCNPSTFTSTDF